ncbi:two-component regulator propeller domain-containing protein [Mucilaginibacter gossypii]|uniref:ligand-binding sensor domain-containing protein n=1 Tax=Mucilaginibacter gossypii TaxID=551996 RepID=UPI000DCE6796|nr:MULTISPECIES: two-component regulator propeller domain-containing protein [Mucilaginibacter]QTE40195.1 two-component regulator propeller domain-containing protein [Mucilaginibacter gossypii]RAV47149.1 histidine kinase [Mucilaginibacter rubeus]
MKKKRNVFSCLIILLAGVIYFPVQAQQKQAENVVPFAGPNRITRNIIQDKKGNIWIAAFDGIFRYDGKSFTNITSKVTSARFFSVLEDKKGNLWFGSIGSGAYRYDGKSFRNFTIKDGLLNNDVVSIYEDKKGSIWFGVRGGTSRYDGISFRNYIINGNGMNEDPTGKTFPDRAPYEVNSIIEDRTGKLWFATRGNTFVYDGKIFNVFSRNGKPFTNVRSVMEDKKGNIWLAGSDGLWRYDGSSFTNFTRKFAGYVYEDKKGNIWTSSESADNPNRVLAGFSANTTAWALSRYDEKSLSDKKPSVTEITNKPMVFGILEDDKGNIWFGAVGGVYRYNGNTITDFKGM